MEGLSGAKVASASIKKCHRAPTNGPGAASAVPPPGTRVSAASRSSASGDAPPGRATTTVDGESSPDSASRRVANADRWSPRDSRVEPINAAISSTKPSPSLTAMMPSIPVIVGPAQHFAVRFGEVVDGVFDVAQLAASVQDVVSGVGRS